MEYEVTIGLEIHAQIQTASKMFCGCRNELTDAPPNTHVCPTCMGLPGALPVINGHAIELAIRTGLALNCQIEAENSISRKNYFYADLPSGYQRSQFEDPLCSAGFVELAGEGGKRIGLTRVHIEEDTGKLSHSADGSALIDYNRAGVPLMEIVSEPDISTPDEARRYFQQVRQVLVWIGASSGDMERGALRCDANVSVRPAGQLAYGAKVEIKNINSFRGVERALTYEIERQRLALDAGDTIRQSTRGWNEEQGRTIEQRVKEGSADYRYFPEPDVPPLRIGSATVDAERAALPELPAVRRARFVAEHGLSDYDALVLTEDRATSEYYARAATLTQAAGHAPKEAANWIAGELFRLMKERGETIADAELRFPPDRVAEIIGLVAQGTITRASAKEVFAIAFADGATATSIVAERGLAVIGGGDALQRAARDAIVANPKAVDELRGGKASAIQFLVGQVMRATRGQANPQAARDAIERELAS